MNKVMFRVAGVLWAAWGLLHLVAGISVVRTFSNEVAGVPESVTLSLMGDQLPFHVRRTLAEHSFNNTWFGLVVLVGSVLVFRGSRQGVLLCTIVGGLAHLGFTIFLVIPGFSNPVGVAMTFIAACAAILGVTAQVRSNAIAPS
ncbi:MAG: hypothetical protein K1X89_10635 [Myxococcaceae bacterium]|nr:hypothetical protein [Myxococcaceae bacterium]